MGEQSVAIPKAGKGIGIEKVIEALHETHPEIIKMKSLARNYVCITLRVHIKGQTRDTTEMYLGKLCT